MSVSFEQNSEELPQRYFLWNLTTFSEGNLQINLNFSDPMLVTQGEDADVVVVRLLKSYFLNPDAHLARMKGIGGRLLQSVSEEEEEGYLVIRSDLPR